MIKALDRTFGRRGGISPTRAIYPFRDLGRVGSTHPPVMERPPGRVGNVHQHQERREDWGADIARRKRLIEELKEEDWNLDMAEKRAWLEETEVDCAYTSGRLRSAGSLVRDGLFSARFLKARDSREKRMDALVEVLCSVPEADYKRLGETFRSGAVLVSIPEDTTLGHISRLTPGCNREFYLSPILEDRSVAWVRHVAAHEAAHLLYHFDLTGPTDQMESEADQVAARWGFPKP